MESRPARGEWIEKFTGVEVDGFKVGVSPRKGRVD